MGKGRPRKVGVKRTASGRASRAGAPAANLEPILLRMRMFGLSEKDARDQKAATFVGRMNLTDKKGLVSDAQYDAAVEFLAIYDKYKRAIGAPDATKQSGGAAAGDSTADYERWCATAKAKYNAAIEAVRGEQAVHRGSNLYAALDYIVCRDEQQWHLVGDARLALNALAHHFGLLTKPKRIPIAA